MIINKRIYFILMVTYTHGNLIHNFKYIVHKNKKDIGIVESQISVRSVIQCARKCSEYGGCTSTNYRSDEHTCDILGQGTRNVASLVDYQGCKNIGKFDLAHI